MTFTARGDDGAPVELGEHLSCKGSLADLDLAPESLAPLLDELYRHVRAKCGAVAARGGLHTLVLAPRLAGMLAHEAMGHPCEADLVLRDITGVSRERLDSGALRLPSLRIGNLHFS